MKYDLFFYVNGDLELISESESNEIPLYPSKSDLVDIGQGLHRVQEVQLVYKFGTKFGSTSCTIKVYLEKI